MSNNLILTLPANTETALLAGGCFWGIEAVFQAVRGVLRVEPGYTGGTTPDPSYDQVCRGETGHLEAVRIYFDPVEISYRKLLEIFFIIHDPTQRNRQGKDVGPQYRSAIFWKDEAQKAECIKILEELRQIQAFLAPIVTELRPTGVFYPAEPYHRDYYKRHAKLNYCKLTIDPKLERFRSAFPTLCIA